MTDPSKPAASAPARDGRAAQIHTLKTWPEFFSAIVDGRKRHEIRLNDRDYRVGDCLVLQEWEPSTEQYTGEMFSVRVVYASSGFMPYGWIAMSIEPWVAEAHAGAVPSPAPEETPLQRARRVWKEWQSRAIAAETALAALHLPMTLTENKTKYPPPHEKYLVSRDGWMFVATPCYGLHQPWWVSAVCAGVFHESPNRCEANPVAMLDTDKWVSMREVLVATKLKEECEAQHDRANAAEAALAALHQQIRALSADLRVYRDDWTAVIASKLDALLSPAPPVTEDK